MKYTYLLLMPVTLCAMEPVRCVSEMLTRYDVEHMQPYQEGDIISPGTLIAHEMSGFWFYGRVRQVFNPSLYAIVKAEHHVQCGIRIIGKVLSLHEIYRLPDLQNHILELCSPKKALAI